MLRRDASDLPASSLFNPWPVRKESVVWLLLGIVLSCTVALVFVVVFHLRWAPNPHSGAARVALMIWAILLIAAAEEIAFRGYALWRLIRLVGFWQAQAIVGVLFMISHLTLGGFSLLPAAVGTITGSILYGVAFARTRGLAAPIALHSGWNIAQHLLLAPLDASATPLVPTFPHQPTQAEYVVMLAIITVVMVMAIVDSKGSSIGECFRDLIQRVKFASSNNQE